VKLSELLEQLRTQLDARGDYTVVVGPLPRKNDHTEDNSLHPIVETFVDDHAQEVILRTSQSAPEDLSGSNWLKLRDLLELLESHVDQCGAFDVETSDSGPEADFGVDSPVVGRVDFPIVATGSDDDNRLFAFLW